MYFGKAKPLKGLVEEEIHKAIALTKKPLNKSLRQKQRRPPRKGKEKNKLEKKKMRKRKRRLLITTRMWSA